MSPKPIVGNWTGSREDAEEQKKAGSEGTSLLENLRVRSQFTLCSSAPEPQLVTRKTGRQGDGLDEALELAVTLTQVRGQILEQQLPTCGSQPLGGGCVSNIFDNKNNIIVGSIVYRIRL